MVVADLIPPSFFGGQEHDIVLWLLVVGAIAILVFGADRVVGAAVKLARSIGMPTVIIGATVVSLGTTSPEAAVSVTAAFEGKPGLALGNAVGSIICDTALIFGLCCLITRLPLDRFVLYRHGLLKLAAGLLLAVTIFLLAAFGGSFSGVVIPRWVGFTYIGLLVGYLYVSIRWARQHPQIIPDEAMAKNGANKTLPRALWQLAVLALGLGLVIFGSDVLVGSVSELCDRYGVPRDVMAVTLVAFGTSLPELVTALTAVAKGHGELMIGNVIGADILNVLFVTGASAAAVPLAIPTTFFWLHLPVMMMAMLLMGWYIFTSGKTFRRWQGLPLLGLYVTYYVILMVTFGR